jgi:outer membrane cobalamin receptor
MLQRISTVVFLLATAAAYAQDTTTVYRLPEVVVSATRSVIDVLDSPSPVDILDADRGSVLSATVADLVNRSNSVFLRDLGGAGALKTVFLRGTAPQHLLVLVNGVRQNSFQNGLVDFSLLPLNDVQRVEIVRGGSSALYGADALGGVVNILTRTARANFRMRADGEAGSYGYGKWKLEGEGRPGGIGVLAGIAYEQGRDEFPFRFPDGSSGVRSNSDFRKRHVYAHSDALLGMDTGIRLITQAVRSDRGVPGSLSYPSPGARQTDDDANVGLEFRNTSLAGVQTALKTSYHYGFQRYKDPHPIFPTDAAYRNGFVFLNPEISTVIGEQTTILAGVEWSEGTLTGSNFNGAIRRVQKAIYVSGEARFESDRQFADLITVYGMVRYDDISDVEDAFMPKVGFNLRLLRRGEVRLRSSYGASFRSPSFNDLYYVGVNNPDLKPEHSTSFDAGIVSEVGSDGMAHHVSLTYFDIRTSDRILFDLTTFRPVNIGRTVSSGFEAKYVGSYWDRAFEVEVNYGITNAEKRNESFPGDPAYNKQLLFIPRHSANIALRMRWSSVEARLSHGIVGKRFTSDDHTRILPEHQVTDVSVSTRVVTRAGIVRIGGEVCNVFNRLYEVFPDYPMPGRTVRLGIGWDI